MNFTHYRQRQTTFLHTLAPMLKIGGILQYVVCSMEPEENEQVVARFYRKSSEF